MIKYRIHQIKDIENTVYAFRGYDLNRFNFADYECRYEGEIAANDKTYVEICEVIYTIFNLRRPEDFEGHSLSVSDVIELQPHGVPTFYYCNVCGFEHLNKSEVKVHE